MIDREYVFERDEYTCAVCGEYAMDRHPQLAHLIPNSKTMKKRYGNDIVNDNNNVVVTCSLHCNNAIQMTGSPAFRDTIAALLRAGNYDIYDIWRVIYGTEL